MKNYTIVGYSEMLEKYVPTAHGNFATAKAASDFALANLKVIDWKVEVAG